MAKKQTREDQGQDDLTQIAGSGSGRWWQRSAESEGPYAGLGEQVTKILRLAEAEAEEIREQARQAAAAIIEQAEQDAARIRAGAEAEAQVIRAGAHEQP